MMAREHAKGREGKQKKEGWLTFICRIFPCMQLIENIRVTACWDENRVKGIISFFPNKSLIYLSIVHFVHSTIFLACYVTGPLPDMRDKWHRQDIWVHGAYMAVGSDNEQANKDWMINDKKNSDSDSDIQTIKYTCDQKEWRVGSKSHEVAADCVVRERDNPWKSRRERVPDKGGNRYQDSEKGECLNFPRKCKPMAAGIEWAETNCLKQAEEKEPDHIEPCRQE